MIQIFQYDDFSKQVVETLSLPLTEGYNLLLRQSPLMLTRQANDGKFQIIWPDRVEFDIGKTESFFDRKGDNPYFCRWHEEPDYREEIIIRKHPTGEIVEVIPGSGNRMPDGQIWVLQ